MDTPLHNDTVSRVGSLNDDNNKICLSGGFYKSHKQKKKYVAKVRLASFYEKSEIVSPSLSTFNVYFFIVVGSTVVSAVVLVK